MKKLINNTMLLLLLMFGFHTSLAQKAQKEAIQAKIKIEQADNLVSVYATAINHTDTYQSELHYSFLSLKKSHSGNLSKNSQSGVFSLNPKEVQKLSFQKLNIDPKGKLTIFLFIRKNGKVLSKDTLHIGSIEKKFGHTPIKESHIEITGLVVENVLTKPGKDFYEFFTQINRMNAVNYPFVIVIDEKPQLGGRNSEISIKINENVVFKFRTQPKEEYLQALAKQANQVIYNYYLKRMRLYKGEKLY